MMQILDPSGYRQMPWANGAGVTVEIARADDEAGTLWRLSMAQVVADGPFSHFPVLDRSLTVIDGPGFALAGPGWRRSAMPLVPVGFAGDVPVSAQEVSGPVRDLNVMWRRDRLGARVRVLVGEALADGTVVAAIALGPQRITVNDKLCQLPVTGCVLTGGRSRIVAEGAILLAELHNPG